MLALHFADEAALFAQLIARTAKDIDVLIDSLPSEDSSPELQVSLQLYNCVLVTEQTHTYTTLVTVHVNVYWLVAGLILFWKRTFGENGTRFYWPYE